MARPPAKRPPAACRTCGAARTERRFGRALSLAGNVGNAEGVPCPTTLRRARPAPSMTRSRPGGRRLLQSTVPRARWRARNMSQPHPHRGRNKTVRDSPVTLVDKGPTGVRQVRQVSIYKYSYRVTDGVREKVSCPDSAQSAHHRQSTAACGTARSRRVHVAPLVHSDGHACRVTRCSKPPLTHGLGYVQSMVCTAYASRLLLRSDVPPNAQLPEV